MKVNSFHDDVDLSSLKGNKMYQKETSGLPKSQLHVGTPKDILKLIERIASAAEELR